MGIYADRKLAGKCTMCGVRPPQANKVRCKICSDRKLIREQHKRIQSTVAGMCRCGAVREDLQYRMCLRCREVNAKSSSEFRSKKKDYNKTYSRKIILEALEYYGGAKCACCGIDNILFLTIDHINNDGAEHRRQTKGASGKSLAWMLKKEGWPPGFQVLCFNCNCGRARNGGVCPHKDDKKWL